MSVLLFFLDPVVSFLQASYEVSELDRAVNICLVLSDLPGGGRAVPVEVEIQYSEPSNNKAGMCNKT